MPASSDGNGQAGYNGNGSNGSHGTHGSNGNGSEPHGEPIGATGTAEAAREAERVGHEAKPY